MTAKATRVDLSSTGPDRRKLERMRWTQKAAERLVAGRKQRQGHLEEAQDAIAVACDHLKAMRAAHDPYPVVIRIRPELFRAGSRPQIRDREPDPDRAPSVAAEHPGVMGTAIAEEVDTRAPLGKLLYRPSNAFTLYLVALYVAQTTTDKRGRPVLFSRRSRPKKIPNVRPNKGLKSWAALIADDDTYQHRRRHLNTALRRLDDTGLIYRVDPDSPYWEDWNLGMENGSAAAYALPTAGETTLNVPVEFWTQGWIHTLLPKEAATYLMLLDMRMQYQAAYLERGIGIADSRRRARYGITGEVYTAAWELEEFGLIERQDSPNNRRAGRLPRQLLAEHKKEELQLEVDRFRIVPDGLKTLATERVLTALKDSKRPPRFDYFDPAAMLSPHSVFGRS